MKLNIGGFLLDNKSKCFIIAELSANHNGNIEIAKKSLNGATKYDLAISIVKSIVDEMNNVNASTLIGSISNDGNSCIRQTDSTGFVTDELNEQFNVSLIPKPVA